MQPLALGNTPFPPTKRIRQIWRPFFGKRDCLMNFRGRIYVPGETLALLPSPFVRQIGSVFFNPRSARFLEAGERSQLVADLASGESYRGWDPELIALDWDYKMADLFGYDPALEDQRMNLLFFEVSKPLVMRTVAEEDHVQADGKVFLHFYACGYVVLLLAISVRAPHGLDAAHLDRTLLETRPWRTDSSWTWSSRIGTGKLSDLIEQIIRNLNISVFSDPKARLRPGEWYSALRLASATRSKKLGATLLKARGNFEVVDLSRRSATARYLTVSPQGTSCLFWPAEERRATLRFFWKMEHLIEFVVLKQQIYEDYANLLRAEVARMKDFRLSLKRKATKEDLRKFDVYDPKIPQFLGALDGHIKAAAPFHRRLYSAIAIGTDFNSRRDKVKRLVADWENEVARWKHGLVVLWKKITSPLRMLLKSVAQ